MPYSDATDWYHGPLTLALVKPLPCPFCGRARPRTGYLLADVLGVECQKIVERAGNYVAYGCGAQLGRSLDHYKRIPGKVNTSRANAHRYVLNAAVKAWNKRAGVKSRASSR